MTNRDTALGIAFAALGVVALIGAAQMKPLRHLEYGPGLFPSIVGVGLIVFGLALAITSLHSSSADPAAEHSVIFRPRTLPLFLAYLLAPFVYILVAPTLGFLLTMSAIIATLVWLADPRPLRALAAGIGLTVVVHILFVQLLRVPLPWGVLEPLAGILT